MRIINDTLLHCIQSFEGKNTMKITRIIGLLLMLLPVVSARGQDFIGCRVDDGWAETPMLRKTIKLEKSHIGKGTIYVWLTSLGYHELYINDTKVGDYVMQPPVSQLDKRACMVYYDITEYLHEGKNEIMIWVGQGWGRIYGTPAAVRAEVWWQEGGHVLGQIVETDSTWEASPSCYSYSGSWQPMQFGGERYDARIKPYWRPAVKYDEGDFVSSQSRFEGNRIVDILNPVAEMPQEDGSILIDFGRVVTGWFSARFLPQPEGHEITMEYLDHPAAKPPHTETDIYISDGNGDDDIFFRNRFHMHAFRYVRIRGVDTANLHTPISEYVSSQALQISSVDPSLSATFECSDPRLNAIHDMVKYTLQCLTFSGYMVDCPHIERMGYGGDGNSSTMTLQTLWDVRTTYYNWLEAWSDAMDSTGDLPYVAPAFRTGGGPYWSGFIIKAPWRTYLNYGDSTLVNWHYDEMCRWLGFVEGHCKEGILRPWPDNERRGWFLGDWLAPDGVDVSGESALFVSNCFISECLADMVRMARMTKHDSDAVRFAQWRRELNEAIHRRFYHPETHTYANGTPLDQSYALLQDIPPDSVTRTYVRQRLLEDCHTKYHDHLAVGLVGVPVFTEWCIQERQTDLMATLLRQPDYPGYLHMIHHGATTTWESWGCERDNGEPVREDRSRVHNCYNGIGIWFYQALAGIRPDPAAAGYRHFFIDPQPCKGIEWVKATKPTLYGTIRVEIEGNRLHLTVPRGTTATVFSHTKRQRTVGAGAWVFEIE